jgi:uncharacterized membrane protein
MTQSQTNFSSNKLKKSSVILASIFLASCAATKIITPTDTDAKRGAEKYPGYNLAELNNDKKVYEQKCASCHRLKSPTARSAEKWPKVVTDMAGKAGKNADKAISQADQTAITRYLITMSSAR